MHTTLYLVRAGDTEWATANRLMGRHDVSLSEAGRGQAGETARSLASVAIAEVLSSPLLRAVETAERIAEPHHLEVSRDARLVDVHAGRWEGRRLDELLPDEGYQRFLRAEESSPGGESLGDLRQRAVASIEQVVDDNQLGANLVVVSHALVLQVLLAHYLGVGLADHRRLRVRPASISVLRFDSDRAPPALLALNHGGSLADVLRDGEPASARG